MAQIASHHAKLQLLMKTNELEEQEKQRECMVRANRNEKFAQISSKNDQASLIAANEVYHRNDEATRRELVSNMRECSSELQPVVKVLGNFEGILLILNSTLHITNNSYIILRLPEQNEKKYS